MCIPINVYFYTHSFMSWVSTQIGIYIANNTMSYIHSYIKTKLISVSTYRLLYNNNHKYYGHYDSHEHEYDEHYGLHVATFFCR